MIELSNSLVIFGAGGLAGKVVEIAKRGSPKILGFISTESPGTPAHGIRVLGGIS